jgi:hypothetical protein
MLNCEVCSGSVINSKIDRITTCIDTAKSSCFEEGEENWSQGEGEENIV